ncbi:MAG TPA: hypothetical protein VIM55_16610 [Mucilaginibacter sp.]
MPTRDDLIKQLSATLVKTKVDKLSRIVKDENFSLRDLIDLTFHEDKNIAFRAAWVLENVYLPNPVFYLADLDYLLARFQDVTYPSCQRHYAKIMRHITRPKTQALIKQKLQGTDLEPVVEKCFDWLIDPKVLIAVKVFAAEALFNLRHRYDWIAEELANQIKFMMRTGTAAIQSRGKKLLEVLEK